MRYCGIIRIHGGSIFVEFVGTPHPRICIFNEIIIKIFIEHFNKKEWYATLPIVYINKQASKYIISSVNNQIIAPIF